MPAAATAAAIAAAAIAVACGILLDCTASFLQPVRVPWWQPLVLTGLSEAHWTAPCPVGRAAGPRDQFQARESRYVTPGAWPKQSGRRQPCDGMLMSAAVCCAKRVLSDLHLLLPTRVVLGHESSADDQTHPILCVPLHLLLPTGVLAFWHDMQHTSCNTSHKLTTHARSQ